MSNRTAKQAPIVRLPPKSNVEILLLRGAQVAMVFIGFVALVFALASAEYILAPITLAVVIGLMLGPAASRLERLGMPPSLSAMLAVVLFLFVVLSLAMLIATPLSFWIDRIPQIWTQLQQQLSELKAPLDALRDIRDELRTVTSGPGLTVTVDSGMPVESVAAFAPAAIAQICLFFASLYFFLATRHQTRLAVLKLCFDRRLQWRVAHIFRDVEAMVSRYLLSITLINIAEGAAVGLALWLVGIPSALLWGVLAILANFIVFVGPAFMTVILFAVGLTEFDTLGGSLVPVAVYLAVNTVEAQFVTPVVIGRTMTMNPFIVLIGLAFWIWLWGPLGGFIAIPAMLIVFAIFRNILPGVEWMGRPVRMLL